MRYVLDGVRFFQYVDKSTPQVCSSTFMNILTYHNPFFDHLSVFNLLKSVWSFWLDPETKKFGSNSIQNVFLYNLRVLFGVKAEILICKNPDQLYEVVGEKISDNRPLYVRFNGSSLGRDVNDFGNIEEHYTHVIYGIDTLKGQILIQNNELQKQGWISIDEAARRLALNKVIDLQVSDFKPLMENRIIELLLRKVKGNFKKFGPVHTLARLARRVVRGKVQQDLPPRGKVCGIRGIHEFANTIQNMEKQPVNASESYARFACREIMVHLKKRENVIQVLNSLTVSDQYKTELQTLMQEWKDLSKSWAQSSKSFAKVYMSHSEQDYDKMSLHMHQTAEKEAETLKILQRVLYKLRPCAKHIPFNPKK